MNLKKTRSGWTCTCDCARFSITDTESATETKGGPYYEAEAE